MQRLIAELADNASPLLTYGPLGAICAWFMFRGEKVAAKIGDLAHRIDGLTKALLVDMVNRENVGVKTKQYAVDTIAKIDARNSKQEDK